MFWKKDPTPAAFWKWFIKNQQVYRELAPDSPKLNGLVDKLSNRLERVEKGLEPLLSLADNEHGHRELIISAGGIKDLIPAVERVMAKAPQLDGWRFVAFKRRELSEVQVGPFSFEPSSIRYILAEYESKQDITLYFENFQEEMTRLYSMVSFILLDTAIGELDVMTKIGKIDYKAVEDAPDAAKPLSELAAHIDALYQ